jgi:hypothetical protein
MPFAFSAPASATARYQPLQGLDRVPRAEGLPKVEPVRLPDHAADDGRSPDWDASPEVPDGLQLAEGVEGHASDHLDEFAAQSRQFLDQHGHTLTLSTDHPSLNLAPWAGMLAGVRHSGEIEYAHIFITDNSGVAALCGPDAVACYGPDDENTSPAGVLVLSHQDPDIYHTLYHEYGHHIDNQLYNLSWVSDCSYGSDGSRRWFFARDLEDNILDETGCDASTPWERLLGELYAEDFAQLNGIVSTAFDPRMPVPPPTSGQLRALTEDMTNAFAPYRLRFSGRRSGRVSQRFRLSAPAFVEVLTSRRVSAAYLTRCESPFYEDIFIGSCRLSMRTGWGWGRYRLTLEIY